MKKITIALLATVGMLSVAVGLALFTFSQTQAIVKKSVKAPVTGGVTLGSANNPVKSTFNTTTDSNSNYGTQDVIGTHIGTSTVGVAWPTVNVTNTYVSVIGHISQATYQILVTAATTTANSASFTVQGSNDYLCGTQAGNASSTTDVVQANINWYDAMPYLLAKSNATSFANGSSTLVMSWVNATAGNTNIIPLDNLDFQCLRLSVAASSTQLYVGLNTRAK